MNVFRMAGDISHLISTLILIHTIQKNKSPKGISLKTQILYAIVCISRYLDIFTYINLYLTCMKFFFISTSIYVIYLMNKYQPKIKESNDNFPIIYLLIPSFILGCIFNYELTIIEIFWSFSLFLESVCILPQLFLLQKTGEAESLTTHYIFALGIYRALYIPNWIYRYYVEGRFDKLSIITGIVQTLIYSDFFYVYYQKIVKNFKFSLPQ